MGGDVERIVGVGLMVGAGPDRIDALMECPPPSLLALRDLDRWKLLADASESLPYVGADVMDFGGAAAERLLGRGRDVEPAVAAAAGRFFFWSVPVGGLLSNGGML